MSTGVEFALFLDFDGTLVEIVERPDAVKVAPGLGLTIARLRDRLDGAVAIVTGRPIGVIDYHLAPYRFDAAGLHGVEQRVNGHQSPCNPVEHPELRAGILELERTVAPWPGVLIEDKGCSVGVHWRLAPEHGAAVEAAARELAARLGSRYRLQAGKAVAEILPAHAGKGPIIRWFMRQPGFAGRQPLFIGDDLTDEQGFAVVSELGGAAIRVGGGDTAAAFRVSSPAAVRALLATWAETGIDLAAVPHA